MTDDPTLRPVWRRTEAEPAPAAPEPDAETEAVDRGRTVALLAALGRMQMSLDVLAKRQQAIDARLARIERTLTERD